MVRMRRPMQKKPVCDYGAKKMLFGLLLFVFGLIKYLGYGWDVALMTVGALIFVKGLIMKFK